LRHELEGQGVELTVARCDSSVREQLAALLESLEARGARPRVIVHAAGVGGSMKPLTELCVDDFAEVAAGKMLGAWHLHELTRDDQLDAFVLYASIAGVWGSARQAHYSGANAFLDALAQHRVGLGLVACSIAWGPWADGGMADTEAMRQLQRSGLRAMDPRSASAALDVIGTGQASATIVDVDWSVLIGALSSARPQPLFELLGVAERAPTELVASEPDLVVQLRARPEGERFDHVLAIVLQHTAATLGFGAEASVDAEQGFAALGLDSLMAVELRQRLQRATGLALPATLTFDFPTPTRAAQLLIEMSGQARPDITADEQEFAALDDAAVLDAAALLLGDLEE
jgi:NAD(P)-dependent dehydrogenase (short-subunit alcohol dehydrogenase family)/acyl carrier protein